jgi:hypothetical protein
VKITIIIVVSAALAIVCYVSLKHCLENDVPCGDIWSLKIDVKEEPDGTLVHIEGLIVESAAYYFETARFTIKGNTLHIQIISNFLKNGSQDSASFSISKKFTQNIDAITLGPENTVVWPPNDAASTGGATK